MSDHLPRTNRWLIALSVILCLILGGIFTRSSAVTSQADAISDAGAFVSEDQDSAEFTSEETLTDSNDNFTDSSSGKLFGRTSSDSSEASPGGPALSTEISPEASEGSWASSGSNWMFLVDDKPYTGWFTDTDGKQYYMDETGIMQTGWTDIGKKRYYFDMDGILQTGTVIIDKKTYELDTGFRGRPCGRCIQSPSVQGKNVKIKGRGYGHGVGMSQNAANEMAKEGYTWQEILGYFFKNTSLETWGKQKK